MNPHVFYQNLGAWLRQTRERNSFTQEKLGPLLGVAFQQIQKYETGRNRIPVDKLLEFCHITKTDIDNALHAAEHGVTPSSAALQGPAGEWRDISTIPSGKHVLVFYKNSSGKDRIVKAKFIAKHTVESPGEYPDWEQYCEEKDVFYYPEGFYEAVDNWDEWAFIPIIEGEPTHWLPLPPAPTGEG